MGIIVYLTWYYTIYGRGESFLCIILLKGVYLREKEGFAGMNIIQAVIWVAKCIYNAPFRY